MRMMAFVLLLLGCSTGFAQSLSGLCMLADAHDANRADRAQLMLARIDCDDADPGGVAPQRVSAYRKAQPVDTAEGESHGRERILQGVDIGELRSQRRVLGGEQLIGPPARQLIPDHRVVDLPGGL